MIRFSKESEKVVICEVEVTKSVTGPYKSKIIFTAIMPDGQEEMKTITVTYSTENF